MSDYKSKILLVDDDKEVIRYSSKLLESNNYDLRTASSVDEAISILHDFTPDILLTDIIMPGKSGYDLINIVKTDPKLSTIYIVVLSGNAVETDNIEEATSKGADGYLIRPISNKELLVRLKGFLKHKNSLFELKEKNNQLFHLFNENADAILLVDKNGAIKFSNKQAEILFEKKQEELLGLLLGEPIANIHGTQIEIANSSLNVKFAEIRTNNILIEGEELILCTLRDVTELRHNFIKMEKLNFLYGYLQNLNKKLLKNLDLEELFNEATDIAIDYGKFLGVKIIKYDYFIKKVTDISEKFNDKIDAKTRGGLFDYFTQEQVILNSIQHEKKEIIFNKLTNKHLLLNDVNSSLLLPFCFSEDSYYLIIYLSSQINYFDDEEISLLKEVRNNLEFKIENYEKEKIKKILESKLKIQAKTLNLVNDPIIVTDSNSSITFWNKPSAELYGWSSNEVMGLNFEEVLDSDYTSMSSANLTKTILKEGSCRYEVIHRKKDLSKIYVMANTIADFDKDGKFTGFVSVFRDITKEKLIQAELENRSAYLQKIFDLIPIMLTRFDPKTNVIYINKEFERKIGWSREELKDINLMENCYPDPEYRKEVAEFMLHADGSWKEFKVFSRYGDIVTSIWANIRLLDGSTVGVGIDIDEKQLIEKAVIEAKNRAEEMNKLKSSFLANMSHEIRTPMIGILGYSEILSETIEDPDTASMAVSINKSANRLLETLNMILDLSKLEAEQIEIRIYNIDLINIVKDIWKLFNPIAVKKKISFKTDFKLDSLVIQSDERVINQILNNLVNNAIKFTAEGEIVLSVSKKVDESGNEAAVIECRDTGIGINEEKIPVIWEEFRQASEGLSRNFEGTGLGLTLTKKFVEKINGKISVISKLGEGSTFKVELPMKSEKSGLSEDVLQQISENMEQIPSKEEMVFRKILYVEDDKIAFDVVNRFLSDEFLIDLAFDSFEAIEKLKTKKYDLILMDINLKKGLDGIQLTKLIRNELRLTKLPIVAITAYAMKTDRDMFIAAGCDDYIAKPFKKSSLVSVVKKNLE